MAADAVHRREDLDARKNAVYVREIPFSYDGGTPSANLCAHNRTAFEFLVDLWHFISMRGRTYIQKLVNNWIHIQWLNIMHNAAFPLHRRRQDF